MTSHTELLRLPDMTATATYGVSGNVAPAGRLGRSQTNAGRVFYLTSSYGVNVGRRLDPEEAILNRLREAEQAKRRADAHARIEAKRKANPVDELLALLALPEYKLEVRDEVLQDILESYPEDD